MSKIFRSQIINSIKYAQEKLGFTLVCEGWGTKEKRCACALGCVLLANDRNLEDLKRDHEVLKVDAAQILGTDVKWVEDFISGFDGEEIMNSNYEAYSLGAALHSDFNPIRIDEFNSKK